MTSAHKSDPNASASVETFEGDYRPALTAPGPAESAPPDSGDLATPSNIRLEPLQLDFLLRLADALNTTLELNTLMHRVADLVRAVIDYRIFAILLVNDRTGDLRMRFQSGHTPDVERMRIKLGRGIVGEAASHRRSILVQDVRKIENYIDVNPNVQSELAVPLIVKNRVIGVIDLQSEQMGYFTEEHQRLLELTASRMAIAVENARLYSRVSRQAQTLTVLNEISREITSILDLDDLLERIGQLLKRVIEFQMFTILLWNERAERFEHRFSSRFGERIKREHNVRLGEGIIGHAAQQRVPVLVPDVRKDSRYIVANPEVRSELSVPLIYKGRVIGVIDLEHTRNNYYNEDHQTTLSTLAAQVAISIANARLYQRISEEEQRLERDLEMAREVQLRLLPSAAPQPKRAEIATAFLPARSIGGDIYDFIDYGGGQGLHKTSQRKRIAIMLGDVSGKAAPAALYAALVSGILRSLAARHLAPAQLLAELNNQLQERKLDSQYVTMLMAVWNDETRTLQIANAGSVQPLYVTNLRTEATASAGKRSGVPGAGCVAEDGFSVTTVQAEGFPLGLFPNAEYEELTIAAKPGDLLVFFSDGIVDAENADGDMFGTERLTEVLREHPSACNSAQATVDAVLAAVSAFQAGTAHFDDETLVVL
ncbi:MAG: GAF domain-containing protein, partial [Acidobacteriota bacterium]|nr:GAF domain-containing protein [Acidobacteriota bacterium]